MLPYFAVGKVVKGFGRGAKELGFPTANMSDEVTEKLPAEIKCGVYFGWASIDYKKIHKMVMSIGYNPYYGNSRKTMEAYILNKFDSDFYDHTLILCIAGYIREEKNFTALEDLVQEIKNDIKVAEVELEKPEFKELAKSEQFAKGNSKLEV